MKQIVVMSLFIFISISFLSCTDNVTDPKANSNNAETSLSMPLLKYAPSTSGILTWPTHIVYDQVHGPYMVSNHSYSFTYEGYNFYLTWSETGVQDYYITTSVVIYVNDQYCSTKSWTHYGGSSSDDGWTGGLPFSYGNYSMSINIYRDTYYPLFTHSQPSQIQIQVPVYTLDPVANFVASPSRHQNDHQDITLTWTASSDPDVSGYEIYREGNLITTITSRTTTQYIDTNIPWGPTYYWARYSIRAYDSVHNVVSSYSLTRSIHLGYAR